MNGLFDSRCAVITGRTGDFLGGEAYWAGGLHLYTPLPFRPGRGGFGDLFRAHFFLNAGNLCNLNYGGSSTQTLRSSRVYLSVCSRAPPDVSYSSCSLLSARSGEGPQAHLRKLAECIRWSYGLGVVLRLGNIARLELNYCIPMGVQSGDRRVHSPAFKGIFKCAGNKYPLKVL